MALAELCIHDIIRDWCADCRHEDRNTIRNMVEQENISIVENLLTWPMQSWRT